ncbi:MAG: glutamine-hydrolyzing GMP synthase, partial [Eubacteriales bacterium]|nr:glutamine-hydrolyzing GMP synthase [Eubacteriales bacterium]
MAAQTVLILDFGGQYKELIARRVRECGVYSVVKPGDISLDKIREIDPIGIILTGGPNSVYKKESPHCDKAIFDMGIPVLGICYGMQLLSWSLGGEVAPCSSSEYGRTKMQVNTDSLLFAGLDPIQIGLMSHTDQVTKLPVGFKSIAHTVSCENAAIENAGKKLYGFQFHPEVESTPNGTAMIRSFLYSVCGAKGDYDLKNLEQQLISDVKKQVGDAHVLLALSGGVDSSVCAALLSKALPGQLHCIFVDHGLMRKDEGNEVEAAFKNRDLDFIRVNAQERFLKALAGVTDPEQKRKIIGTEFVRVFEDESKRLPNVKFLAQGTIYPDVIESGGNKAATIKSHHNVAGLPKDMKFEGVVEPLRGLFKDEVRALGRQLGLPRRFVERQPFPGPGLAVRVMGDITPEKLEILREADAIFREEVAKHRIKADQYFAVLTDTRSVGVVGDFRTYNYVIALRAVKTSDFMTC